MTANECLGIWIGTMFYEGERNDVGIAWETATFIRETWHNWVGRKRQWDWKYMRKDVKEEDENTDDDRYRLPTKVALALNNGHDIVFKGILVSIRLQPWPNAPIYRHLFVLFEAMFTYAFGSVDAEKALLPGCCKRHRGDVSSLGANTISLSLRPSRCREHVAFLQKQ
ncbi:MAG: hypothetical protein LQ338_003567 [Usnochroma carphineum]|nr:MAG: hypothetical protein LQ338_003567 [Usnochroma carphineum]